MRSTVSSLNIADQLSRMQGNRITLSRKVSRTQGAAQIRGAESCKLTQGAPETRAGGARKRLQAGVRGHPWAMCCSLIGETFCPG